MAALQADIQPQPMGPPVLATENILIIKLSALGDFLLALGAMEAIKRHHPDARLTLLTTRPFVDMAQRSGYFDEILVDKRPRFHEIEEWYHLYKCLNAGRFTRVYDLQMNNRMKLYRKLFRKKPEWSGVIPQSPLFYDNPVWRDMHAFKRHQEVLKVAGINDVAYPDLSWMETDVSLFGLKNPYVLLIPGSAPARPEKRWSALKYGALAVKLARDGYGIGVIGTDAEADVVRKIVTICADAKDLSGRTSFEDIATLARYADATVGNDTGPTHLASLTGCPVVALFSAASDPAQSAPVGPAVTVIQADDMNAISVADVYQHIRRRKTET